MNEAPPLASTSFGPVATLAAFLRGILQPTCPACARPLDLPDPALCRACRVDLVHDARPWETRCTVCDGPCDPGEDLVCRPCGAGRRAFGRLRGAVRFNAVARALIHELKYMRRTTRVELMGDLLGAAFHRHWGDRRVDLIVPVPLHRRRQWRRGFNQSAHLAEGLGRRVGGRVEEGALVRVKATVQQVFLTPEERARNVADAFAVVEPGRLVGGHVLLVDDVATSGATLHACARTMLAAGAGSVECLVFARA